MMRIAFILIILTQGRHNNEIQKIILTWTSCIKISADLVFVLTCATWRGGGLGSRPKKMYGERLGDGVEYHLMKPTPRR